MPALPCPCCGATAVRRTFYQPGAAADHRRGHREHGHPASRLGYEDRPDQVERLQIESFLWERYLPDDVIIICTDRPGYQILHQSRWLPVRKRPGHFTVNLGDTFRVLTRELPARSRPSTTASPD
ncbi:hypothetical protein LUX01_00460 [Streptomyces sudanensis]|uniref:hypothetical protein n=1 Tax=Streptomyces sudanensis TaxID=436397 RepID=UPI0020CCB925|nr:hypothetical protein [Streptomyces sudanensis]MCP9985391.1 hypothetical protein [Streptomyces sudanensis]